MDTKIYLTDQFIENGNIIPFVIVEAEMLSERLECKIATAFYDKKAKEIKFSHTFTCLYGKRIVKEIEADEKEITEFRIKRELANFLKDTIGIDIDSKFKLKECSVGMLYALTFAEIPYELAVGQIEKFYMFNLLYEHIDSILDANAFGNPENIWINRKS